MEADEMPRPARRDVTLHAVMVMPDEQLSEKERIMVRLALIEYGKRHNAPWNNAHADAMAIVDQLRRERTTKHEEK